MPRYTEDPSKIIYEEDVRKMWASAQYEHERVLLSLLWFTGARPSEILELKRKDINWGIGDDGQDFFEIKLITKKLGKAKGFVVTERILRSSRPIGTKANLYIETIIKWCRRLLPEDYVIPHRSRMALNKIMHKLSKNVGHVWSVYHFRHSVFTHLARNHASLSTLMYWKGATNMMSVKNYIQATPVVIQIENQKRSKNIMEQKPTERFSVKTNQYQEGDASGA